MIIDRIWPPYALRLQCEEMELTPVRDSDLPELAEIARNGVRRDGVQAFPVDWDTGSPEQIARSLAQYHWATRANLTVEKWTLEFTVRIGGRAVGIQGVSSDQYPLMRTVSTGSWLAPEEQSRGFGTRMRSMVIDSFARHFGAHRFDTGYIDGNAASRRVSEKLGYCPNGHRRLISQDGSVRTEHRMVLFAADYEHTDHEVIVTGAEPVRRFLGLEQNPTGG